MSVQPVNELNMHVEVIRIKLKHGIALADCYVLAFSRIKRL